MQIILRTLKTSILIALSIFSYSCKKNNKPSSLKNNENLLHIKSEEGEKWNVLGVKIVGKILSTQTNNKYSVIISETPPNQGPPLHVHKNEDELFYVLKGVLKIKFEKETKELHPGECIVIPKGTLHQPIADEEVEVMLFEPSTTLNTGNVTSDFTKTNLDTL